MEAVLTESVERDCIRRCQTGRRDAFEPLVRRYGPGAFRFALGMVRDEDTAKDLSQEAFIRAYRAIQTFDPALPFYPWFHQILRRLCLDHLRRKRPTVDLALMAESLGGADGRELARRREQDELRGQVRLALDRLPGKDREILVLREFQRCSYAEIAAVLQIPRGTVMSRLYYARRRLRDELNAILGADPAAAPANPSEQRDDGHAL
ncbi:MAG: sigma-70 family RNA polymerase sigma factor [Candidatus Eisenbacteria bacterium]|nr:sigma-70 family RNA polymerase sigma factor [Candidatus Eisenbacteria bacterium]